MVRSLVILASFVALVAAQAPADLGALETAVRAVAPRIVAATVAVWGGSAGSGVIVSEDGDVLTAAHVLRRAPGRLQLTLADGRRVPARLVGRIAAHDAALVRLTGKGPWPFCPLAPEGAITKGQPCLATGMPNGPRRDRPPPLRMGTVLDAAERLVRSSCAVDQGDSGGPLFDLEGRVIGIHSRIGSSWDQNYHVTADAFRALWTQLEGGGVTGEDAPFDRPRLRRPVTGWRKSETFVAPAKALARRVSASVVEFGDGRLLGCVVRADGWIVTKASDLAPAMDARLADRRVLPVRALRRDDDWDLAVVKVDAEGLTPIAWADEASLEVGRVVLTPLGSRGVALGIVGADPREIGRIGASLGVVTEKVEGGGARITEIKPGTAAERAGLKLGEVILAFDGCQVAGPADLLAAVRTLDPQAKASLTLRHGDSARTLKLVLGSRRDGKAHRLGVPHLPEPFQRLSFSRRRSGFPRAVQHDTLLTPRHCGGPLLDRAGRAIALNVARASRHASYAIPAREVVAVIDRLLALK